MKAGRAAVPKICWVSRSSSWKGSVRINMGRFTSIGRQMVLMQSLIATIANLWWQS